MICKCLKCPRIVYTKRDIACEVYDNVGGKKGKLKGIICQRCAGTRAKTKMVKHMEARKRRRMKLGKHAV